jgi:Leucine-rich repeat (LRR) protein
VRAFENLSALTWLDLSHNRILELVAGTFDALSGLIHLDLSFNHLQVLDGRLIQGLVSLSYFNVRSNNVFKVEKGFVENCPACRTVILTGKSFTLIKNVLFLYLIYTNLFELNRIAILTYMYIGG